MHGDADAPDCCAACTAQVTEWRPAEDGSLWVRMEGELGGTNLLHAAAIAHEADLWPKWLPLCGGAETLRALSPLERLTYVQFDLTPMMRRGALIHWSLSDALMERQSLLLLGASLGDPSPVERPAHAATVKLAEFKAIKVLITPMGDSRGIHTRGRPPSAPALAAPTPSLVQFSCVGTPCNHQSCLRAPLPPFSHSLLAVAPSPQ